MLNIPQIENSALKVQAAKQIYSKQIVLRNNDYAESSSYIIQASPFKILSCQVKAMAAQDNMCPVGRKFNIFA